MKYIIIQGCVGGRVGVNLCRCENIFTEQENGVRNMTSAKSRNSSEVPLALEILPVAYEYILWELPTVVRNSPFTWCNSNAVYHTSCHNQSSTTIQKWPFYMAIQC